MRLFLDTSVLLAACGSTTGASHEIFRLARRHGWTLMATPYVIGEVLNNLPDFPPAATAQWASLRADLVVPDDVLTLTARGFCRRQGPSNSLQRTGLGRRVAHP